jgi:hypothetical protein
MFYIALNTYIQDITLSLTSWSISADINLLYTYIQDIALSLTSWSISAAMHEPAKYLHTRYCPLLNFLVNISSH